MKTVRVVVECMGSVHSVSFGLHQKVKKYCHVLNELIVPITASTTTVHKFRP